MNSLSIVLKNLKQRSLSTFLTILSIALGAALIVTIQIVDEETRKSFSQTSVGYDLILTAPGSQMQATLNSIYHMETSVGVIPIDVYKAALNDGRIAEVYPLHVGDSYRGFRVVGTNEAFLSEARPRGEEPFSFREGRNFNQPFEAVIGHDVANRTGLQIGDTIFFTHGVAELGPGAEEHVHDDHPIEIVGILDRSFTPNDRVIFSSMYSTYRVHALHDHDHDHSHDNGHQHSHDNGHDHSHDNGHSHSHDHDQNHDHHSPTLAELELTVNQVDAVLIKMTNSAAAVQLAGMINFPTPDNPLLAQNMMRDPFFPFKDDLMAVVPANQINQLMGIIGNAEQVLKSVSYLVLIVALLGVMVAMYNTMGERKGDIAVMRSLGARRSSIFRFILYEAGLITLIGCLIGLAIALLAVSSLSPILADTAGVFISEVGVNTANLITLGLFIIFGVLAGIVPAFKAYKTDVASNLS